MICKVCDRPFGGTEKRYGICKWCLEQEDWTKESGGKKDECFIATATMGNRYHPFITILRHFRDTYLLKKYIGRVFVKCYYKFSPPIARIIGKSNLRRRVSYLFIVYPLVCLIRLFSNKSKGNKRCIKFKHAKYTKKGL